MWKKIGVGFLVLSIVIVSSICIAKPYSNEMTVTPSSSVETVPSIPPVPLALPKRVSAPDTKWEGTYQDITLDRLFAHRLSINTEFGLSFGSAIVLHPNSTEANVFFKRQSSYVTISDYSGKVVWKITVDRINMSRLSTVVNITTLAGHHTLLVDGKEYTFISIR